MRANSNSDPDAVQSRPDVAGATGEAENFDACVSDSADTTEDWFAIVQVKDEFALWASWCLLQGFHSIRSGECNCNSKRGCRGERQCQACWG